MYLPQDPFIKSQYINMMLKTNNMDLQTFCISANIDMNQLLYDMGRIGISYDAANRQFRTH